MTMIHEPAAALVGAPESPVRRGLADVWPVCVGLAPFALAIGAAISSQGMRPVDGLLGGAFVLGGSAQLAGIDLVGAGAGAATVVVTIALVNLRFALYSASFASCSSAVRVPTSCSSCSLASRSFWVARCTSP